MSIIEILECWILNIVIVSRATTGGIRVVKYFHTKNRKYVEEKQEYWEKFKDNWKYLEKNWKNIFHFLENLQFNFFKVVAMWNEP